MQTGNQIGDGRGGRGGQQRRDAVARVLTRDDFVRLGSRLVERVTERAVGVDVDQAGRDQPTADIETLDVVAKRLGIDHGGDNRSVDDNGEAACYFDSAIPPGH